MSREKEGAISPVIRPEIPASTQTWKPYGNGAAVPVTSLADSHLINVVLYLERHEADFEQKIKSYAACMSEVQRRGLEQELDVQRVVAEIPSRRMEKQPKARSASALRVISTTCLNSETCSTKSGSGSA